MPITLAPNPMQAPHIGWVITTDKDDVIETSFHHNKSDCINNYMISVDLPGYANTWRQLKNIGYQCQQAASAIILIDEVATPKKSPQKEKK